MKSNLGNAVIRFDIGCRDSAATQKFYTSVFGWKTNAAQHTTNVNTQNTKGIDGSITSLGHEPHNYVMIYIEVNSVTEAIKKIVAHGGQKHIGPLPTGTGQYFAWVHDPEGTQLGIVSDKE
ncbi:MAG: VOC family protein [Cyclobacteriaceae bacterium]